MADILGHGLPRPRSPILLAAEVDDAVEAGDLSCTAMRRRLFAVLDCLHTSLSAQLESLSGEDEDFTRTAYFPFGLEGPDMVSSSSSLATQSADALEQLVLKLLVAAVRPQILSLRELLRSSSSISASAPPLSSAIALLLHAGSIVILLLQHVSFLHGLSQELSRCQRLVCDIAPALASPSNESNQSITENMGDTKQSVSAYIQARGALSKLRRKVDHASRQLWFCERMLCRGDATVSNGFATPAAQAIEVLLGCRLCPENEDEDMEMFASSLLPGKPDLMQLLSLLQVLRLNRYNTQEQHGTESLVSMSAVDPRDESVEPSVPDWVRSSHREYPTEFSVMDSAPAISVGSISRLQDEEADANKLVDVYTTYIPNRYPDAKRTRKSEGSAGSVNHDHTLNLLHELRRHLRDRGVRTVERVRAQLGDADDIDGGGPRDEENDTAPHNQDDLLSHIDEVKSDNQLLVQSNLSSFSPQARNNAVERHPPLNNMIAQPLLSELFSKVRSAQNVQAAAVFGSDSDIDSDR